MCSPRRDDDFSRTVDAIVVELKTRGLTWRSHFPTRASLAPYGENGSLVPGWISEQRKQSDGSWITTGRGIDFQSIGDARAALSRAIALPANVTNDVAYAEMVRKNDVRSKIH